MSFRPSIRIDRKHARVQELVWHVMHALKPHLREDDETPHYRDAVRALEDLFDAAGAYIVTDAIRAEAGLPIRNSDGLTYEELQIIEAKMLVAMLETPRGWVVPKDFMEEKKS